MLFTLLLPGLVSTILASAILRSSLGGYGNGYFDDKAELSIETFEPFAPDNTGSIDWPDSIEAYEPTKDKGFKQGKLKPTQEDPCPSLYCLCSKKQQHYTVMWIDEADPYDSAADLNRQICNIYQIYCCSLYDPQKRKGRICYNAFD